MTTILDIAVVCLTVAMMLSVGIELQGRHFRELMGKKTVLLLSLGVQTVVLPAIGLVLIRVLRLPAHLSAGLLLMAACPVGDIANFYALLARSNVALCVTTNVVSCLLCVVTMLTGFAMYDYLLPKTFAFAVPGPVLVLRLVLLVALPILGGMLWRKLRPGSVRNSAMTLQRLCLTGLAAVLLFVIVSQRQRLIADWQRNTLQAALFISTAMLAGFVFSRSLRLPAEDTASVTICFGVRNVGLAMTVAVALLHQVEYTVFATIYFVTEAPLALAVAGIHRRQRRGSSEMPAPREGLASL